MKKDRSFLSTLVFVLGLTLCMTLPAHAQLEQSGKGMKIWFDTGGPVGGPFNTIVQNGAMQAQKDLGVEISFVYSDWSPEKVVENFKKALAVKPDGIVFMGLPGDDAMMPLVDEAYARGIAVTCVDTNVPKILAKYKSRGFGFIGTDYDTQGTVLADEALKRSKLKKGDRAFVWGLKRLEDRGRRARAILRVFEKAGLVVDYLEISPEADKDSALGTPIMTGYLSSHPECKMIVVDHGALTSQMENFLKAAGVKPGTIFVAGFSLAPATASGIESGYISLVSEMQPYLLGYLSVCQIVMTKKYGFTGLEVDTGGGLVDKSNIAKVSPLAKKGLR